MNSYNDLIVATVAFAGATLALASGIGPWPHPYRLRSIAGIVDRYGITAARCIWIGVAIVSLIAGIAILSGLRPGYANPDRGLIDQTR